METKLKRGQFQSDLMRNYKQLREAKAQLVVTNAEKYYRRQIEDMVEKLGQYQLDRQDLINELTPGGLGNTSVVPSDFSVENMYEKDMKMIIEERNLRIKLDGACRRYQELFGPLKNLEEIQKVLPDVTIYQFETEKEE